MYFHFFWLFEWWHLDFYQDWTRSQGELNRLRSEPRTCLRENQNKEREPFLKIASSGTLARVLESLGELYKTFDHRILLAEAAIETLLENSCAFYDRQIILLNIVI